MQALESIASLGDGYLIEDIDAELQAVSEETIKKGQRTSKVVKGKVTVTFEVTHLGNGDPTVIIVPTIDRKFPTRDTAGRQFYLYDGAFHRNDPRQPELNVRVVETPASPARTVETEAAPAREVNA